MRPGREALEPGLQVAGLDCLSNRLSSSSSAEAAAASKPVTGGMALAVPTRIGPLLGTPLVSLPGRLRMLLEPFVPARRSERV
jgi:hypothetical protein